MTQPVQEPLTQRSIGSLQWGQNQLFRRPDPFSGGGGNLAYAYAEWLDGGDVPDDAELGPEDLGGGTPYEDCYISPEGLTMETDPFSVSLTEGVINWCSPGLYIAQFVVQWADSWVGGTDWVQTKLNLIGSSVSVGNCCSWATRETVFNDWQVANFVATGMFLVPLSNNCEITPSGIKGTVWQKSGGDKFLSQAGLIICKLASFDEDTGQFCLS